MIEEGSVYIRQKYVLSLSGFIFCLFFLAFLAHRSFIFVSPFIHSFPNALWTSFYSIPCLS